MTLREPGNFSAPRRSVSPAHGPEEGAASITIIGPNPAIDRIFDVPGLQLGSDARSRRTLHVAGGKPMNVARCLRRMGYRCRLVAPLGDSADCLTLRAECAGLGVELVVVPIRGSLRTCVVLVDQPRGTSTLISEEGPELSASEAARYVEAAETAASECDLVVCSGSLGRGLPSDFYARIARLAREAGRRCLVDTSGAALKHVLGTGTWGLKVNEREIATATGAGSAAKAALLVTSQGVNNVVITRGSGPSIYAGEAGRLEVFLPDVTPVNPTAAGDAFLAGLVGKLSRFGSWTEALRVATAAAGQVTSTFGPDLGSDPELDALSRRVQVIPW